MTGRILQFGTSRFLQAHVDLFLHEARQAGQDVPPVAVVQASGSAERAGRVAAFGQPYPVIIRGFERGAKVDRQVMVASIDRGLSAARDWAALTSLFVEEATYVVSNMGDTGYAIAESDCGPQLLSGAVPASFPGKLTALLHARWRATARPLTLLPCELVNRNGAVLQAAVLELAAAAQTETAFRNWIRQDLIWADTLVDRIVSAPLEPIGAVAEPYAIWAIEARPGLVLPCTHPCITLAQDLEPFERLKLHILNLGHTVLADLWRHEGRDPQESVRAILADPAMRARLHAVYDQEVLPGFARRGMQDEARAYIAATLDRFLNPFLDHRIADIAQNHATKVQRRIEAFLAWAGEAGGLPPTPLLDGVIGRKQESRAA